ncbi:hypothetical protein Intca_2588 [Intrasporangium calvum DSM 43043]|uniref:Pyridoxamine 5'-phosphate oxidase-related FMN-binding protein n=1 Tax=Intrasporangium calvum (strain ATCC 23552 / DSM 43043 / JCM 3097 / NBRC 12989 / NCIMB 10167 / NRRL B-3866 / 7 KIP) TaxID=710696 RepID=E6S7Z7_INTC7|nr:hypothetical protein Intca_2588 [Intrasporangium calvum DSM 43043]
MEAVTEQPPPLNLSALLSEAMNKSSLLWVDVAGDRTWPAWHVWDGTTAFVVSGPGEQPLPWLPKEVTIILRSKDSGGRLLATRAHAAVIAPGTPEWDHAAELLRASRLNSVDDSLTRWARECTITALTPFGSPLESPGSYSALDLRAEPARTTVTTSGWRPWHWKGRRPRRANDAPRAARKR